MKAHQLLDRHYELADLIGNDLSRLRIAIEGAVSIITFHEHPEKNWEFETKGLCSHGVDIIYIDFSKRLAEFILNARNIANLAGEYRKDIKQIKLNLAKYEESANQMQEELAHYVKTIACLEDELAVYRQTPSQDV